MPDEVQQQPSELERLVAEAEASAVIPVTDVPKPCNHPVETKTRKCPTCLWSYCDLCASPLDPTYCRNCLNEPDAHLKEEPLIDDEGVQHEGRHLTPDPNARFFQPRFGTLAKTISQMTEADLEDYIKRYKDLVKQAETALDFRRVVLGSAQIELSQRQDATRRKLRTDKTKYPIKTLTIDKNGNQKKKAVSTADLVKMLEMLKAIDANRKKKAAEAEAAKLRGTQGER